ncbi:MAG: hypothetical protein AB7Q97_01360 [Gammaproteobacteria bacterium]
MDTRYNATDSVDRNATRLFHSAAGQALRKRLCALFRADRNAGLDRQGALINQAGDDYAYMALLVAIAATPEQPRFFWCINHPRVHSDGLAVPGSRCGIDNPDNVYRSASVSERYRYVIRGRKPAHPPADAGITVMPRHVGDGMLADGIAFISLNDIPAGPDGSFEITLDRTPAAGRRNHLCIEGGRMLFARDTHLDWCAEAPHALSIECLDRPPVAARTDDDLMAEATRYGVALTRTMLGLLQHTYVEHHAANVIKAPRRSGDYGGLVTQMGSMGWYDLADDEALIVEADPLTSPYLAIQICDLWMVSYDYVEMISSLNNFEARADADRRYRFVICAEDPGVHNWLDSGGHRVGSMTLRWQNVPPDAQPRRDTVISRVVKRKDLRAALPPETAWADAAARAAMRAARRQGWQRRVAAMS